MRWTERALAFLLITMSLAAPGLAADESADGNGGDGGADGADGTEGADAPDESSQEPAPASQANNETDSSEPEDAAAEPEASPETEPSSPSKPARATGATGAGAADAGAETPRPADDADSAATGTPAPPPPPSPEVEAEPDAENESLSLLVQLGDVALVLTRSGDEASEIAVSLVDAPEGDVGAQADGGGAAVDVSLLVGLVEALRAASEEAQPGAAQPLDDALAFLRANTNEAASAWTAWDTGSVVVVVPAPMSGSGGAPDGGEDGDGSGGCLCFGGSGGEGREENAPGDGGGQGGGTPTSGQVTRTVMTVRDAATGAVQDAVDKVTERLPPRPGGPSPSLPEGPVPAVTVAPGDPAEQETPARTAAAAEATPAMPLLAKATIATMALAGIAVPLASAGNALPFAFHKLAAGLRKLLGLLGVPLYAKLKRDQVMTHPVRESIVSLVQAEPGIHAQRLRRELNLGWGTLAHHLRVLESWGHVVLLRDGNKVKAFPSEWSPAERRRAAALANPGTSQVFQAIVESPGAEQRQLAAAVGRSHPTVIWHAERLQKAGLIRVERRGRRTSYFAVATVTA